MKLYLSSFNLGDRGREFARLAGGAGARVAVIMNATDHLEKDRWENRQAQMDALRAHGLIPEPLDLRDYFGKPEDLQWRLRSVEALWVTGGNCFVLRRAMSESSFDVVAKPMIEAGRLVYAGYSAGACVAGLSLRGLEIVDAPDAVPSGYLEEIQWSGLGLVDYSIAPHYKSEHPESALIDEVVAHFEQKGIAFRTIEDGDAIVFESPLLDLTKSGV